MIGEVASLDRHRHGYGSPFLLRRHARLPSEVSFLFYLHSISHHKAVQVLSPEGTAGCSLGRKPQVRGTKTGTSPEGATQKDARGLIRTWVGLRPRLPTAAASRLRSIAVRLVRWTRGDSQSTPPFVATGCIMVILMMYTACFADDTVVIKTGADGKGQRKLSGTIVSFDAQSLTMRSSTGRDNRIPATAIISYETTWPKDKIDADRLFASRKFDEALAKYRSVSRQESREWARRLIQADVVWCLRSSAQPGEACNEFFRLMDMDATKQNIAAIPLAWSTPRPTPSLERRARTWLDNKMPIVRLMGASWLLSVDRGQAVATLERLTSDPDLLIAKMAEAQLWSTKIVTASEGDIGKWTQMVAGMPEVLRGGPYFALGRALAYHKQPEQAALAFMRVPTLYPKDSQLVVEALLAAAAELEKLGRTEEASSLYRELVNDFQETPQAAQAAVRLKAISGDARDD